MPLQGAAARCSWQCAHFWQRVLVPLQGAAAWALPTNRVCYLESMLAKFSQSRGVPHRAQFLFIHKIYTLGCTFVHVVMPLSHSPSQHHTAHIAHPGKNNGQLITHHSPSKQQQPITNHLTFVRDLKTETEASSGVLRVSQLISCCPSPEQWNALIGSWWFRAWYVWRFVHPFVVSLKDLEGNLALKDTQHPFLPMYINSF